MHSGFGAAAFCRRRFGDRCRSGDPLKDAVARVLGHLAGVGFRTREGGVTPFGEELPLVDGVAWDHKTAQVAFVVDAATRSIPTYGGSSSSQPQV